MTNDSQKGSQKMNLKDIKHKISEQKIEWHCRFHPTDWWHEVGCSHQEWSKEDLQSALEAKKRFEQAKLKGVILK